MAKQASQPGATLLGSATGAMESPTAYLLKRSEEERKRKAAMGTQALTLATAIGKAPKGKYKLLENVKGLGEKGDFVMLSPNVAQNLLGSIEPWSAGKSATHPKSYEITAENLVQWKIDNPTLVDKIYQKGDKNIIDLTASEKDNVVSGLSIYDKPTIKAPKVVSSGQTAIYQTKEDAIEIIKGLGIKEGSPNFDRSVAEITAPQENLVGEPLIRAGQYQVLVPYIGDGANVTNIIISPSKSLVIPPYTIFANKRLVEIAELKTDWIDKSVNVIPSVNMALETLFSGEVETGKLTQWFLPLRQVFGQAFQSMDAEIPALESIQAISYKLAPKMRPPGSGSTSDMEFIAYQKSIAELGNTPLANYISLYAFKKMTQNALDQNQLEEELLTKGYYRDSKEINAALKERDTGIYEKYTGDLKNEAEIEIWYNSLPEGAVFINNKMYDTDDLLIVKGAPESWGKK